MGCALFQVVGVGESRGECQGSLFFGEPYYGLVYENALYFGKPYYGMDKPYYGLVCENVTFLANHAMV